MKIEELVTQATSLREEIKLGERELEELEKNLRVADKFKMTADLTDVPLNSIYDQSDAALEEISSVRAAELGAAELKRRIEIKEAELDARREHLRILKEAIGRIRYRGKLEVLLSLANELLEKQETAREYAKLAAPQAHMTFNDRLPKKGHFAMITDRPIRGIKPLMKKNQHHLDRLFLFLEETAKGEQDV